MSPPRLVAALGVGVVDPDQPILRADDLGLTRGDGCFEVTRIEVRPDGATRIDHLDAHLTRFVRSADALDIAPVDLAAWRELIDKAVAAWTQPGEALLRLMLTRGRETAPGAPTTGVLTIAPIEAATLRARRGITVVTLARGHAADAFTDVPWLLGGVKTISYAVNVAAGREAARRAADEVLFVSSDGFALEAPRAALIWRAGERLHTTRHAGTGILASITQAAVFAGATSEGVGTSYDLVRIDDLHAADGAWLASSGRGIAPILALDGRPLDTDPTWTTRLWGWFTR
jgi:4-amino-4-deoxychorismate lyase